MHLFLTTALPFLGHDHASAVAFLTCRSHNFHASIIPEFLSDEERVRNFCETRQQSKLNANTRKQYADLYNLFVQTPLMQFSPSLVICQVHCAESILKPLLETKYLTHTLQRCSFSLEVEINNNLLHSLSNVQSLTEMDFSESEVKNEHLEIIINCFLSLETLTIRSANRLKHVEPETATKTLRNLTMCRVDGLFATQFVSHFPHLRKLVLSGCSTLNLLPLSSSLPLLTDLHLENFDLKNTDSIKSLVHLSSLQFRKCRMFYSLSFLTQENSLPELTTLCIDDCRGLSSFSSFAPLSRALKLRVLEVNSSKFNNGSLKYLENMVHLQKLNLTGADIVGDSQSLKTLMQNLFQLEELSLWSCHRIGGQGAIAESLYSSVSRIRALNLSDCCLVDDDLNGIGALKNTLEVLHLDWNSDLTNESLAHCKELVGLKKLNFQYCDGIDDLSPLKDCLNLVELGVSGSGKLIDDSFKVFSEEPNSFPSLRVLNLSYCPKLTENVFEHLSKNSHLVYQLKEMNVNGMPEIVSLSSTARNNICQLKRLRRLSGILDSRSESDQNKLKGELMQILKNLEEVD